jgi:hypothetical protein
MVQDPTHNPLSPPYTSPYCSLGWCIGTHTSSSASKSGHFHMMTGVPRYTNASLEQYSPHSLFDPNDPSLSIRLGIFSFSPVRDRFGFLLNGGASASTQNTTQIPLYKRATVPTTLIPVGHTAPDPQLVWSTHTSGRDTQA